jgi:hypothetical protein
MFLKAHKSKIHEVCITQANLTEEVKGYKPTHIFPIKKSTRLT